jgi:hypothetical protein
MLIQRNWTFRHASPPSAALLAIALLLGATFAFGGSARGDEVGLLVLRPISAIALLFSLYLLKLQNIEQNKFWSLWLAVIVFLTIIHLIPMPPKLWQQLPGRQLAASVDSLVGYGADWRPISLSPELTRNALLSMMGPLACYLLMLQLSRNEVVVIFAFIIVLGALSGLISVIQITQGAVSPFYFYRITNLGTGVGLFANRNHQAVLLVCLIPIGYGLVSIIVKAGSVFNRGASMAIAKWCLALGAIFIFVLVLVTGSRGGLLLFVFALALVFIYTRLRPSWTAPHVAKAWRRRKSALQTTVFQRIREWRPWRAILPAVVVVGILFFGRNDALRRLTSTSAEGEARLTIYDPLLNAIQTYLPLGSGVGSFDPVFRGHEKVELLTATYWNHAHNDWAEMVMTGGIPAVVIVLAAIFWLVQFFMIKRPLLDPDETRAAFSFMGGSVLALTGLSSIFEYPLRVPIMTCVFVMAIALLSRSSRSDANR